MSEAEIRAWIWECSKKRIIDGIVARTETWTENGPSKMVVDWIVNVIWTMPVPQPEEKPT